MICFSYFLHHRSKFLIFSCHITVVFLLMRELTIRTIFKSLLIIFEISAAFVSKGIKRAIAEQTVKVLRISSSMAGKILTFLMAEISVFFIFPIIFSPYFSPYLIQLKTKYSLYLFRNAPKSMIKMTPAYRNRILPERVSKRLSVRCASHPAGDYGNNSTNRLRKSVKKIPHMRLLNHHYLRGSDATPG